MVRGGRARPGALGDAVWTAIDRPLVVVPVGSTEQHGPHLPFGTDTLVASAVVDGVVARARADGVEALAAPALAYGASGEHQDFPGTSSIGTQALTFALLELGRSMSGWAGRIVLVNGHGGNVEALATAVPVLRDEERPVSWLPCGPAAGLLDAGGTGDAHAGRVETSLVLAIAPDLVRRARAEPGNTASSLADLMPALRAGGVRQVAPNGVLGDPSGANAVEGERLLAGMVDDAWARIAGGQVDGRGCLVPTGRRGPTGSGAEVHAHDGSTDT